MTSSWRLTAIIERDGAGFVAFCPELDVVSQGDSVEEARTNLAEALEQFLEFADPSAVDLRLRREVFVTTIAVAVG